MIKQYDDPITVAQRQFRAVKATKPEVAVLELVPGIELWFKCTRDRRKKAA